MMIYSWLIILLAVFFIFLIAAIFLKGGASTFASFWAMLSLCTLCLLYFSAPPLSDAPVPKKVKINHAEALVLFNLSANEFQRELDWTLQKAAQGDKTAKDRFGLLSNIAKHRAQCYADFISGN